MNKLAVVKTADYTQLRGTPGVSPLMVEDMIRVCWPKPQQGCLHFAPPYRDAVDFRCLVSFDVNDEMSLCGGHDGVCACRVAVRGIVHKTPPRCGNNWNPVVQCC